MSGVARLTASTRVGGVGLASVAVSYGFARYGYGLLLPEMRVDLDLSTEALGLVASAGYVGYLLAVVAAGWLCVRTDPRVPVAVGGVSAMLGMALLAAGGSAPAFAVGAVLAGASSGWTWAPFSDLAQCTVPVQRRPRVLSVVSTGTTFGLVAAAGLALLAGTQWRVAWA
ncbi:MAG: MFS transporter, partial [Egibacteraceae bacterium]